MIRSADTAADVARGDALIAEHGGFRQAVRAAHPDRGGSRADLEAVLAARDAIDAPPKQEEHFVLIPPEVDPSAANTARGLDSSVELALRRISDRPVRVTDGVSTWAARWIAEVRSGDLLRLMFAAADDPASPLLPIVIKREKVKGAVYFELDGSGRGELRIALADGRGVAVVGNPGST